MIRAILIDDEQLALTSLERKIHKFQGVQCIASYTDPNQALVDLSSLDADVAFVDIEMYDISGIELAEKLLAVQPKLHIVFVTAHAEYAVEAFELNSIDYLLKPVTSKRLEKTMSRLLPAAGPVVENHISSSREQTLRVLVFHDFQAWYGDHLLSFKTAKVKELFAYFVMHRNTSIHRDVLIEALFGEHDYKKAKIHFHTCLSHLRKTLEAHGFANGITFVDSCYIFSMEGLVRDCDQIDAAYELALPLTPDKVDALEAAIPLYTGGVLELNGYEWAYALSEVYRHKAVALFNRLIDYYQGLDLDRAHHYLQLQHRHQPYSEHNIQQMMLNLVKKGQRSEALRIYKEYERMLSHDFDLEPDEKLTELYHMLCLPQ